MRSRSKRRLLERGAAAVEFAFILPILLLVIGGTVDFGRALYTQVTLTNAAREGARAAVVGTVADAAARANAASQGVVTLPPVVVGDCAGGDDEVRVTVSTPTFDWIILGPALSLIPGSTTVLPADLSSSATMRCGG
jgi:Flp pilus assembly pilin Flp